MLINFFFTKTWFCWKSRIFFFCTWTDYSALSNAKCSSLSFFLTRFESGAVQYFCINIGSTGNTPTMWSYIASIIQLANHGIKLCFHFILLQHWQFCSQYLRKFNIAIFQRASLRNDTSWTSIHYWFGEIYPGLQYQLEKYCKKVYCFWCSD